MNFLSTLLLSLISSLPGLIQTAEKAFSGAPGSGEAKKKLVLDSAVAAIATVSALEGAKVTSEQTAIMVTGLAELTDANVKTLNSVKAPDSIAAQDPLNTTD